MEKKTYLMPATTVVMLSQRDGILTTLSGGATLTTGGKASKGGVSFSDTKYEDDYDLWDEE